MPFTTHASLTAACTAAQAAAHHVITLVAGLDGHRYYLVTSTPDLGATAPYVHGAVAGQSAHAEMHFICDWPEILRDFRTSAGRLPKRCELFLSHSPCRNEDDRASPPMTVSGVDYGTSCKDKLTLFFRKNGSIRFSLRYWLRFASAEAITGEQLRANFGELDFGRMTPENNYGNPLPRITA
ncbi:hypothetical protein [Vannielia litorea]|uniref:Uncharacterized protein n=1 Tax=Vannielia litorea TaxID=1217970 RepID=A0A1N6FRH2_9RHOB|nr:hypothetical protein [Vannielia litorea]SIN97838.1 hypothetical protein SAMN05444002_1894 [Vannielia litorea]